MPTYEFRCPQGHEFEKFYRTIGSAEAQPLCLVCGQPAERFMSPAGFAFKGSGFYLTDYGKNAHREKGSAAKPAASEGSTSSNGAKPESKPDAKADSANSAGVSSDTSSSESKTSTAKPAESKPVSAPAKKSSGE